MNCRGETVEPGTRPKGVGTIADCRFEIVDFGFQNHDLPFTNRAWGMEHGAWGMGHGAWSMGHGAWGKRTQNGEFGITIYRSRFAVVDLRLHKTEYDKAHGVS